MLSEVTTHLTHITEGWTAWMSKGGERAGGVPYGYLEVNRVSCLDTNDFSQFKNASFGWIISKI